MTQADDLQTLFDAIRAAPSTRYRPAWNAFTGSPLATLLLCRILYHWEKNGRRLFSKYNGPCRSAPPGDTWREELGFTRRQFESARARIARRVTAYPPHAEIPPHHIVAYCTDSKNQTWYYVNESVLARKLAALDDQHRSVEPEPVRASRRPAARNARPARPLAARAGANQNQRRPKPGTGARNALHVDAQNGLRPNAQIGPQSVVECVSQSPLHKGATASTQTAKGKVKTAADADVDLSQDLVAALNRVGDADPVGLIECYGADKVSAWLDYCLSPAGRNLTSIPGFIRSRLKKGQSAPAVPSGHGSPRHRAAQTQHRSPTEPALGQYGPPRVEPTLRDRLWDEILAEVKARTYGTMFRHWFESTRPLELRDGLLRVAVESETIKDWLDYRLRRTIDAAREAIDPDVAVEFVVPPPEAPFRPAPYCTGKGS